MIISDEQVRRAVEYLRTSDEYEGGGYGDAAVSQEFVTRVTEALEEVPDVRTERVAEARERFVVEPPHADEIASKLIGRVISDAIR